MPEGLNESQFYMWRTLFAVAHADDVVTDEEVRFMAEAMTDIPFSEEQRAVLNEDVKNPQDIAEMFGHVTDPKDQAEFFKFAHKLVWVDGDYGAEEQAIMLKLKSAHIKDTNVDELVGSVDLEFEDENAPPQETPDIRKAVCSFRDHFLQKRFGDDQS